MFHNWPKPHEDVLTTSAASVQKSSSAPNLSWSQNQPPSAEGSADSHPCIWLAALSRAAPLKLLWPAYSSCFLYKQLCSPPPPQLQLFLPRLAESVSLLLSVTLWHHRAWLCLQPSSFHLSPCNNSVSGGKAWRSTSPMCRCTLIQPGRSGFNNLPGYLQIVLLKHLTNRSINLADKHGNFMHPSLLSFHK